VRLPARGRALAASALLVLAGCAPVRPPAPAVDDLAARYRAARDHREGFVRALTADLVVRVDGRSTGRLPGVSASLALAAPDRARVRANGLLGMALDVCARDDSVFAWVPSERVALALGGASESLSVGSPVALLGRALGATWDPPRAAWRGAVADSAGWTLAWREGADSLVMLVDRNAQPVRLHLARADAGVTVRYTMWDRVNGEAWPSRVELADDSGWARVRLGMENTRVSARASDDWFALRLTPDTRRLDWGELRDLLGRRRVVR